MRWLQVTYFLTKAGEDLIPMLSEMCHWGTRQLGIPPNLPMMPRARPGPPKRAAQPPVEERANVLGLAACPALLWQQTCLIPPWAKFRVCFWGHFEVAGL